MKQWVMLIVLCIGGTTVYALAYIRGAYYVPLQEALGLTHTQLAFATSAYGVTAMICYFPGGWLADRFPTRNLLTISFLLTGIGGFYFATFPSYQMYAILMAFWGVTTTFTYWAALIKATRELEVGGQGAAFGLLEGGRGLAGVLFSAAVLAVFAKLGSGIEGFRWVILIYSVLCLLTAPLTWFVFSGKRPSVDEGTSVLEGIKKVLTMPSVWLIALIVMFAYSSAAASTYMVPFASEVMGAAVLLGAVLGTVRTWVRPLAAAGAGFFADKAGISRTICWMFIVLAAGMFVFVIVPARESLMWVVFVFAIVTSLAIFALRGLYYAVFEEGDVPIVLMGTATGFVSLIGYTPDVFVYPIAGYLLDAFPGGLGYRYLFGLLAGLAICGLIVTLIFRAVTKEHREKLELAKRAKTA